MADGKEKDGGEVCGLKCEPEHAWGREMGCRPCECCLPDTTVWGRALRGLQVINLELPCTMLSKDICQIRRIKHVLDLTDY